MATRGPVKSVQPRSVAGTLLWPEVPVLRFGHRFARRFAARSLVCALAACARDSRPASPLFTDDFGDTIVVGPRPVRIVSLNPATTELLFAIGAGGRVVGRTSYDIFPDSVRNVPDLGPGLRPNVEAVLAAHPDLVILYASADNRDAARRLRASGVPTVAYRVDRIADFARVTYVLGGLTGDTLAARRTIDSVLATLARVRMLTASLPKPTVFWPMWVSPLLSVGGGSFLNELLVIAGATNVFAELPGPSPAITFEELLRRDPDVVLTGRQTRVTVMADPKWGTLRAVRQGRVFVVDTTMVNGPSARIGTSAMSLARLLHPGATF